MRRSPEYKHNFESNVKQDRYLKNKIKLTEFLTKPLDKMCLPVILKQPLREIQNKNFTDGVREVNIFKHFTVKT